MDISTREELSVSLRYCDKCKIDEVFLGFVELESANSETIAKEIIGLIEGDYYGIRNLKNIDKTLIIDIKNLKRTVQFVALKLRRAVLRRRGRHGRRSKWCSKENFGSLQNGHLCALLLTCIEFDIVPLDQ